MVPAFKSMAALEKRKKGTEAFIQARKRIEGKPPLI
jgi:hypothetical protein